jgi:uncharacterized protein
MYDHLGGGFHRYSVDARWLVPHFEKMLYDNALLARAYLHGYQLTGREGFRRVADGTLEYVLREMRSPEGGFYSSQDADSEGVEGRFYVWTADEIDEALGEEEGRIFRAYYDVTERGNWEGVSILNTPRPAEEVATELGVPPDQLDAVVARSRETLYARRAARVWPGLDDKVLTSWNAMMLHSLAEAARVLDSDRYRDAARANAEFLLGELRSGDTLHRAWRGGVVRIPAFLEDHALLVDALVALHSATFEPRWLKEARALADAMLERFWSPREELFHDAPKDGEELVVRPRDIYDTATPSGTSAAARALLRLGRLVGEPRYERVAGRVVQGFGEVASRVPQGFGNLLVALAHHLTPPSEVALVGDPEGEDTRALRRALDERYLPFTTIALLPSGPAGEAIAGTIPLLHQRTMREGRATAYVCRNHACQAPVTSAAELRADLERLTGPGGG